MSLGITKSLRSVDTLEKDIVKEKSKLYFKERKKNLTNFKIKFSFNAQNFSSLSFSIQLFRKKVGPDNDEDDDHHDHGDSSLVLLSSFFLRSCISIDFSICH